MDWEHVEGNWKLLKLEVKERWPRLTDLDLEVAGGNRERLIDRIVERYDVDPREAEEQVQEFEGRVRL